MKVTPEQCMRVQQGYNTFINEIQQYLNKNYLCRVSDEAFEGEKRSHIQGVGILALVIVLSRWAVDILI